jgi:hypothetical protein
MMVALLGILDLPQLSRTSPQPQLKQLSQN